MVKRLRQAWSSVMIIFRADSGFCRWRMLSWCERNNVGYIVGIAKIEHTGKGINPRYVVTNQFRLLLSSLAYMLLEAIRRLALQGTKLAHACVGTLRLQLLKVGAVILRNTRRI